MLPKLCTFSSFMRMKVANLIQLYSSKKGIGGLKRFFTARTTHVTKKSPPGGIVNSGDGIQPIKMAYNSYESTNPSLASRAPPVIIMHGLMGSKNNWNSISKFLHNKCRRKIFSVDARNHGDSPHTEPMSYEHIVQDILQFMTDFEIKEATLMGHSMGGRAVMLFALKYPEFVEKLIVVDISPVSSSPSMNFLPMYLEAMRKVKLDKNMRFAAARKEADKQLASHIIDSGSRQFFLTNLVKGEGGGYKWRLNITSLINNFYKINSFPSLTYTFEKPSYFIGGSNSDFIRREDHDDIRKTFKNAKFTYISGAGHLVHLEQPEKFVDKICEFLKEK